MSIDNSKKLPNPEHYINFVHYQDIDSTTSQEDLKDWYCHINIACIQIENSKPNKSKEEQARLEEIRLKGIKVMQKLGQKLRDLGINPV